MSSRDWRLTRSKAPRKQTITKTHFFFFFFFLRQVCSFACHTALPPLRFSAAREVYAHAARGETARGETAGGETARGETAKKASLGGRRDVTLQPSATAFPTPLIVTQQTSFLESISHETNEAFENQILSLQFFC